MSIPALARSPTWQPPSDHLSPVRQILLRAARLETGRQPLAARRLIAEELGALPPAVADTLPDHATLNQWWNDAVDRAEFIAALVSSIAPPDSSSPPRRDSPPPTVTQRSPRPPRSGASPSVSDLLDDMFASAPPSSPQPSKSS